MNIKKLSKNNNNNIKYKNKYLNFILGLIFSQLCLASKSFKKEILIIFTKYSYNIILYLYKKGFILSFSIYNINNNYLKVYLKYYNGLPLFNNFKILSKPSKKVYINNETFKKFRFDKNIKMNHIIVSTSFGLMNLYECYYLKIGGEALISIN